VYYSVDQQRTKMLTLKKTAQRIFSGTCPVNAVKEHIDLWNKSYDANLFAQEPPWTGLKHLDAWLAGAAHHEATLIKKPCPTWANHPKRFLREPFCIGGSNSRLLALVETPFSFRLRLVFIGRTTIKSP
jgi:hypothetical protein